MDINHKAIIIIVVVALLGLSAYYAISMGTLYSRYGSPQMSLTLKMPKESTHEDTIAMSDIVMEKIMGIEGIQTIGAFQNQSMDILGSGEDDLAIIQC